MQGNLPLLNAGLLYECANPDCFHVGTLLTLDEVDWKDFWNSEIEDLDLRSVCPSCKQPMMIWDGEENGKIQTFV